MKKCKIVQNVEVLKKVSEPVVSVEEATGILSKLEPALDSLENGLGLAAVQIGIHKQVGLMTKADGTKVPLINPELLKAEDEFVFSNEGCLSFPRAYINTKRYRQVLINNHVIDGDELRKETQCYYYQPGDKNSDGLLCIQVQHEIDHFNGVLFQEHKVEEQSVTVVNSAKKIGRNDKCPCGSGKKYKKCCMS